MIKSNLYFAVSGKAADITSYSVFLRTHKPSGTSIKDIHEHFVDFIEFVKSFKKRMKINSNFILIYKKNPYYVTHNLLIEKIEDYEAIGSGSREAKTALYLGKGVEKSIEVACENNIYCNYPIDTYEISKDN